MRWLKHLSTAQSDEKMALILAEHGPWGYGCFWLVLETIAQVVDEEDRTFICLPEPIWRKKLGISSRKLSEIFGFFQEIGIFRVVFEKKGEKKSEILITVDSPNILKYRDEWARKKTRNSGVTPEPLRSKESDTESESEAEVEHISPGEGETGAETSDLPCAPPNLNSILEDDRDLAPPYPDPSPPLKPDAARDPPGLDPPCLGDTAARPSAASLGFEILAILGLDPEPWAMQYRGFGPVRDWLAAGYAPDEILEVFRRRRDDFATKDNPLAYVGKRGRETGTSIMDEAVELLRESRIERCGSRADPDTSSTPTDDDKSHPLWPELGPKMALPEFRTWISPCVAEKDDRGWRIKTQTRFARDWLEQRMDITLRAALGP